MFCRKLWKVLEKMSIARQSHCSVVFQFSQQSLHFWYFVSNSNVIIGSQDNIYMVLFSAITLFVQAIKLSENKIFIVQITISLGYCFVHFGAISLFICVYNLLHFKMFLKCGKCMFDFLKFATLLFYFQKRKYCGIFKDFKL